VPVVGGIQPGSQPHRVLPLHVIGYHAVFDNCLSNVLSVHKPKASALGGNTPSP